MSKRNATFLTPLVIVTVALLAVWAAAASATGTRTGGRTHLYEADNSIVGTTGTVILTGAINDYGTDHQGVPTDGTNRLVLSKGSFSISVNTLGNRLAAIPTDQNTCSSAGSATAGVPIIEGSGTGAYQGISGTFETKGTVAVIFPRPQDGGACGTSALAGILLAQGSGTISYK
jgi:hypothetical protein